MARNDAAKYAFFYVLSLVALVFMTVSVGIIVFQIINKEIIDLINQYSGRYSDEAMKFAKVITEMISQVKKLGPSPMKGNSGKTKKVQTEIPIAEGI